LKAIFDEANSMPSVESRYFQSMPLRVRTSEVKGQSHFNFLLCDNQFFKATHDSHDPANHQRQTTIRLATRVFEATSKNRDPVAQTPLKKKAKKCPCLS
jgi:hypothetical protein